MKLEVIILAAGKGTRMGSKLPKVLHQLAGQPLLQHVIDTALALKPNAVHVVVGYGGDSIRSTFENYNLNWVEQFEQLGTGHAVLQVLPHLAPDSQILVLYGDVPLLRTSSLSTLLESAQSGPALLTAIAEDPSGYGRVLRTSAGDVMGVVEDKDASATQRQITEINTGVLAAPMRDLAELLPLVNNENQQGEYYLPDVLGLAVAAGKQIQASIVSSMIDTLGVNDKVQLNQVEREYQLRQAKRLMRAGVSLADANRLDVRGTLRCGEDVSIDVNVIFEGEVVLGNNVAVGPNCVLRNVRVGDGTQIHAMSHLDGADLGATCSVGPYARLRPGTVLGEDVRVGNFVEIKKSSMGAGSKANHLAYIGDCTMGEGVNIGAGTITCNYDGANKFTTSIGDRVFVGSNSTLVAPVRIESEGFVAAGSTVTKAVAQGELAVSRVRQRNVQGWKRPQKNKMGD